MLSYAIEAGKELIEVKRSLAHGEFTPWCEASLTFKYATAADYMKLAKVRDLTIFDHARSINAALALIEARRPATTPQLDQDTAQRIQKLARMANGAPPALSADHWSPNIRSRDLQVGPIGPHPWVPNVRTRPGRGGKGGDGRRWTQAHLCPP